MALTLLSSSVRSAFKLSAEVVVHIVLVDQGVEVDIDDVPAACGYPAVFCGSRVLGFTVAGEMQYVQCGDSQHKYDVEDKIDFLHFRKMSFFAKIGLYQNKFTIFATCIAKTENMHFALYGRNPGSDTASRMMTLLEHLIIKGVRLSFFSELADCLAGAGVRHLPGEVFASGEDLPADVDIFLSLGGDGTFLSSLTMVGRRGIPVAGINFGRLGFLTSAGSGDAGCGIVDRMIAGDYGVRERSLLLVRGAGT